LQEVPPPEMEGPSRYRVFFAFDRANLTETPSFAYAAIGIRPI
jgi:hypothetical protein